MIWKTIPGFSRYEASDEGLIRVAETGQVMRQHVSSRTKRRAENQADIIRHREARNR